MAVVKEHTEEEIVTCKGCLSLSGDIIKDEEKKRTYIKLHCLSKSKTGDKAVFLLKTFEIPGLSLENNKLPKYDEYPEACSEHSTFRDIETPEEKLAKKLALVKEDDEEDLTNED